MQSQQICDTGFVREFSGTGHLEPAATKNLRSNELLVVGRASLTAGGDYQAMAVKFTGSGTIIWSILLGGNGDDRFDGLIELSDNSYLGYGYTKSFGHTTGKIFLARISPAGTLLWSRQLGQAASSAEKLYALSQYTDGDLVGTFTINDSTSTSDPVVFKLGLDGTMKWAKRFDHGGAENFNALAFEPGKIYVSGFYTDTKKKAVISTLNATDGTLLGTRQPYHTDASFDSEADQVEMLNGNLSYVLRQTKWIASTNTNAQYYLMVQADPSGANHSFELQFGTMDHINRFLFRRNTRNDYFILNQNIQPILLKLDAFNQLSWSTSLAKFFSNGQINTGFDMTPQDGAVSAGFYKTFSTGNLNRMMLTRVNNAGNAGPCTERGNTYFKDTVSVREGSFSWQSVTSFTPDVNETVSAATAPLSLQSTTLCTEAFCHDATPIAPPCNKTMLTEYGSHQTKIIQDVVSTTDGGRLAVGSIDNNGWLLKLKSNSDIEWSKQLGQQNRSLEYRRVLRLSDNNLILLGNSYYTLGHTVYNSVNMTKMDNNGNILASRDITNNSTHVGDLAPTPDGGFVIVLNDDYGSGHLYTHVIRYDINMDIVWSKEIKYTALSPIYRSIFCNEDGVYIGHDSYDSYNTELVGLIKLDYATGNNRWNKRIRIQNSYLRFSKIMVNNDTLFAFVYRTESSFTHKMVMLRLTTDGDIVDSKMLKTDPMPYPDTYNYMDVVRPTVSLTADGDFVMANQVEISTGVRALNIARFAADGTGKWSKTYRSLNQHTVFNIHPQGNGSVIVGSVRRPNLQWPQFNNAFLLKVDDVGDITLAATGDCASENSPFGTESVTVAEFDSRIDSVINDAISFTYQPRTILIDIPLDATLYCNRQSDCIPVTLGFNNTGCSIKDTVSYYLVDNNCRAAGKWKIDPSAFEIVSMTSDTLKLKPLKPGSFTVQVEVEDDCSVRTLAQTSSFSLPASALELGKDTVICTSVPLTLHAGPGYSSYVWNDASTDSTLTVNTAGTYYVKITDHCGGESADTIIIKSIGDDFAISGPVDKCNADVITLTATTGYYNYTWASNGYFSANGNTAQVNPLQTTAYAVEAEKVPGCSVKDTFIVVVKTSPPIGFDHSIISCHYESITLAAPAGFSSYQWSNGGTLASISVNEPGQYWVSATYSNGCISADTITTGHYPVSKPSLGIDAAICREPALRLDAGNFNSYTWSTQELTKEITVRTMGEYWVRVTDQYGCESADSIIITAVYENPSNFLITPARFCYGDDLKLNASGSFSSYQWSTGGTGSNISVKDTGMYVLVVKDNHGCTGRDSATVFLRDNCPQSIYIPTAFTPGNDGRNDHFMPKIYGLATGYQFSVYNRWGQIVFRSTTPGQGWDGRFNGQLQAADAYVWYCHYQFPGQPPRTEKGTVMLVR